jgi:type II secretory pathway pseudopilin PulG
MVLMRTKTRRRRTASFAAGISRASLAGQRGYLLLSVMLLVTVMLIMLAVEAPRIAQQIQREKEEELVNRGKEYAMAIKRFYHKNGAYPVSLEQLEDTNHIRFLRKRFKDPMTPEGEWKLIHVGEAQFNLPTPGIGAPGQTGTLTTSPAGGAASASPSPGGLGGPSGLNTGPGGLGGTSGLGGGGVGGTTGTPQAGPSGQMGTLATQSIGSGTGAGGGPIMGVASMSKKTSIKEYNGNSEYDQWLFVYDPRLEQTQGGIIIAGPRGASAPPMPGPPAAPPAANPPPGANPPAPNTQLPPPSPTMPPAPGGTPQQ